MPGFLIQEGATVMCAHGGQALPAVPSPAVSCEGMPVSTIAAPWTVAGCPGVPPAGIPPCVTAQWALGTVRVTSYGQPLVIMGGVAITVPGGVPLIPVVTQVRVSAT
ncbi:MAG: hypothetical protein M3071_05110 [Actinomycetota bacterium]|nr:hypothetical protein [Actinomycetota bacterium]